MKEIDITEQKKIELSVLEYFCRFCEDHNLDYFLAYGTLLGTVRHKGFIPWDDDIDIIMPRDSYDRFLMLFQYNETGNYACVNNKIDPKYPLNFSKVFDKRTVLYEKNMQYSFSGVYIDIFPLDRVGYQSVWRSVGIYTMAFLHNIASIKAHKRLKRKSIVRTIVSDILYFVLKVFSPRFIVRALDSIIDIWTNKDHFTLLGNYTVSAYLRKEMFSQEDYSSYVLLSFEHLQVRVPVGYKNILKQIYGDYMKLPPEDKRVYRHGTKTYWL